MDRLTIVSHDRFQEIIDEANRPDSIIRTGVVIGRDIPDRPMKSVEVAPLIMTAVAPGTVTPGVAAEQRPLFKTEREREVARATLVAIKPAEAAAFWCEHASTHAKENGGKPWSYLLIPHDVINEAMTLQGLAAGYT